ncbi:unnamed protein product [Gongylonema pulchrum]|uniref:RNA-dependent RNA polymerase n=1 Tax=Gongylonema pulchrum TaxID=637853 RepID=A0A183DR59_9BILA|nr:unnamed protein product [Gongylonema pulchrum]
MNIALKHSKAVDFPKTGIPPDPLTRTWTKDENEKVIPPERACRWPDFMCKNHEPSYVSPRLVGQLFRRVHLLVDVFNHVGAVEDASPLDLDPDLEYPGWEDYRIAAQTQFDCYHAHIKVRFKKACHSE